MSDKSSIEWTDATWNPVTGCTKISAGCENCYAATMHQRLQGMGSAKYQHDWGTVICHPEALSKVPGGKGKRVFVCSMSDLFHKDVPSDFISDVLNVIVNNPQHTFQILTKRAERLKDFKYPANTWVGVTVENQEMANKRIPHLLQVDAPVRFMSIEPMLGPIVGLPFWFNNHDKMIDIDWVICGGESGPNARPMHPDWARSLRDQCATAGVPFFLKQMAIDGKMVKMPKLDGVEHSAFPGGE